MAEIFPQVYPVSLSCRRTEGNYYEVRTLRQFTKKKKKKKKRWRNETQQVHTIQPLNTGHQNWQLWDFFFFFWKQNFYHHYENTPIKKYENCTTKNWKFLDKNYDIFHISAQNVDCGYSLEPPRRGGSNEYHNLCFWAETRKVMYTPINPSFTI